MQQQISNRNTSRSIAWVGACVCISFPRLRYKATTLSSSSFPFEIVDFNTASMSAPACTALFARIAINSSGVEAVVMDDRAIAQRSTLSAVTGEPDGVQPGAIP